MATTAQENKDVIRRSFDAVNDRDKEAFIERHTDDAVLHDSGETVQGAEAIAEHLWGIFEPFPDLSATLDTIIAEDDMVAARVTWSGTHEGAFQGIEPTGTEIEVEEMGLFRVEDGKVVMVRGVEDRLGLLEQLDAVEYPGE